MIFMKRYPWLFLALALSCQPKPVGPWSLDRTATMLDEGQSIQLNIRGVPVRKLEWSSGDEAVAQVDRRIGEAARLGFKKIFISSYSSMDGAPAGKIKVVKVADVPELVKALFK